MIVPSPDLSAPISREEAKRLLASNAGASVWKVTIIGGTVIVPSTKTLTYAVAQARSWALQGWPAFITKKPATNHMPTKVEVTKTLDVIVCSGRADADWIEQVREILRTT